MPRLFQKSNSLTHKLFAWLAASPSAIMRASQTAEMTPWKPTLVGSFRVPLAIGATRIRKL
jgi:hypothetical protein